MTEQLTFFKKQTVAQYVYSVWLWHYRNEHHQNLHPMTAMKKTAKQLRLSEDLIERIVNIQSRWNARKFLRKALAVLEAE